MLRRVALVGGFLIAGFALASWRPAAAAADDHTESAPGAASAPSLDLAEIVDAVTGETGAIAKTGALVLSTTESLPPKINPFDVTGLTDITAAMDDVLAAVVGDGTAPILSAPDKDDDVAPASAAVSNRDPVGETASATPAAVNVTAQPTIRPAHPGGGTVLWRNDSRAPAAGAGAQPGDNEPMDPGDNVPLDPPVLPVSAPGLGTTTTSSAGATGGPVTGAMMPGGSARDGLFSVARVMPEEIYPLRERANDPAVSPD